MQLEFAQYWQGMLSDYVTVIAWSPNGETLAASSASGEVMLCQVSTFDQICLHKGDGESINCLAFSVDGEFLAVGGQNGLIKIWRLHSHQPELVSIIKNGGVWIDRIAWCPRKNQLAFVQGQYVRIWNVELDEIETTLIFDSSSVCDLTWHPSGESLVAGGYQGAKIWMAEDWNSDSTVLPIDATSLVVSWSGDGKYLASGNMERTITVLERSQENEPWVMEGFPGKIRYLAWSDTVSKSTDPMLAVASTEVIFVWSKEFDTWKAQVLSKHEDVVQSLQFQPNSHLLASAAKDGWVCLWNKGKRLAQVLVGATDGFSCLCWHPQGHLLAAGGNNGELIIWSKGTRAQGFKRR